MFQFVSKQLKVWTKTFSPFYVSVCFKTIESVDLDIFSLFQFVSEVLLYIIIYMFQCFKTPDMGSGIFTFLCFSLFRKLKVWT